MKFNVSVDRLTDLEKVYAYINHPTVCSQTFEPDLQPH